MMEFKVFASSFNSSTSFCISFSSLFFVFPEARRCVILVFLRQKKLREKAQEEKMQQLPSDNAAPEPKVHDLSHSIFFSSLCSILQNGLRGIPPASTKHHGSYEGGLAEHSLNVHKRLTGRSDMAGKRESAALPS